MASGGRGAGHRWSYFFFVRRFWSPLSPWPDFTVFFAFVFRSCASERPASSLSLMRPFSSRRMKRVSPLGLMRVVWPVRTSFLRWPCDSSSFVGAKGNASHGSRAEGQKEWWAPVLDGAKERERIRLAPPHGDASSPESHAPGDGEQKAPESCRWP